MTRSLCICRGGEKELGRMSCIICLRASIPTEDSIHFKPCQHLICVECGNNLFKRNIYNNKSLQCPSLKCKSKLDLIKDESKIIQSIGKVEYEKIVFFKLYPSRVIHCFKCDKKFINPINNMNLNVSCDHCKQSICTNCISIPHPGTSCQNNQLSMKSENEKKTNEIVKSIKRCPGLNCGILVEKISGCQHVVCLKCSTQLYV
ncbi:hypothetical protein DFA_03878 [Cavenderia fasciculata]|uniref:RING-type domain-containing protein n=1 Tax=Cavenderia fasciculata TaxID=261658 RepID=F4Q0N3_CACFS|nr:uncharacterized protein DFA_03878 [Cavenderia fasciculata]EGG18384.1 hypothetical protein DFA_03878 [Cavenderia fasciculata]|eukprot:XP_004366288.1 hypothetical protein DFA_03878 [Cavenderia fasciculata]